MKVCPLPVLGEPSGHSGEAFQGSRGLHPYWGLDKGIPLPLSWLPIRTFYSDGNVLPRGHPLYLPLSTCDYGELEMWFVQLRK